MVSFVLHRARRSVPADKAARLELAVEEWAANVCNHAYSGAGGTLAVSVREERDAVLVEIRDEGRTFDPTTAEEPDVSASLAEREPGGLGLLLIRRMLGGVSYRRVGEQNVVTFTVGR